MTKNIDNKRRIAKGYLIAKKRLIETGFADEIDWQYGSCLNSLNEEIFLQEVAWVILNSGMKETVIRNKFAAICNAFCNLKSAKDIVENVDKCRENALKEFNHTGKIDSIINIAIEVNSEGFSTVHHKIQQHGLEYLRHFPYLGPITSIHLAKNIGIPIAKPDRHMTRLAINFGYNDVQHLCKDISDLTSDPVAVIDIVLWRFTTLYKNRIMAFASSIGNIFPIQEYPMQQ